MHGWWAICFTCQRNNLLELVWLEGDWRELRKNKLIFLSIPFNHLLAKQPLIQLIYSFFRTALLQIFLHSMVSSQTIIALQTLIETEWWS
jgi:hypothetical protein